MKTHLLIQLRWLFAPLLLASLSAQPLTNERYTLAPAADGAVQLTAKDAGSWTFRGDFVVLMAKVWKLPMQSVVFKRHGSLHDGCM